MASQRKLAILAILPLVLFGALILLRTHPLSPPEPSRPESDVRGTVEPRGPDSASPSEIAGAIVEGLTIRRGRGIAARIEARPVDGLHRGPVVRTTTSGADGRFRLEGLAPGRYEVRAVAPDRAVGEAVAEITVPGARVQVRINIPAGTFSLSARAVWADGRPFRGLVRGTAWTETGPKGRFQIRGLGRGTHRLVFLLPEVYRSRGHEIVVPADRELVLVVDEGAIALVGRVVDSDNGASIPNVLVVATGGRTLFAVTAEHRVRSDAKGRFCVRVPMTYRCMTLTAEGYRPCRYFWPWEAAEIEIPLDRAHRATGHVETREGRPVAGVTVIAEPASLLYEQSPPVRTVSGEDGRFVFEGIAVENVVLFARGGGWVSRGLAASLEGGSRGSVHRTLSRDAATEIRVVVEPGAAIEGGVVDPDGRPIAGALVRGLPSLGRPADETPLNIECRAATEPDGRFRLTDILPDAAYKLSVTAPGYPPATLRVPPVPSGETTEVEIVLPVGGSIEVLAVVAGTGRPVAGALIQVATESGPSFPVIASARTNDEGRALLEGLPGGLIRLRGRHADHVDPGPATSCLSGLQKEVVRLEFTPGLAIGGRVLFADGTPVPHGCVVTWPVTSRGNPDRQRYSPIGAGGEFRRGGHPPGRYRVEADTIQDDRRHVGATEVEAGDEEIEIVLAPEPESGEETDGPVVKVRVLDQEGRLVPRAEVGHVELDGLSNDPSRTWSRAYLGRTTIDLDAGTKRFWLYVHGACSLSGVPLPLGPVLLGPIDAGELELEIRLPPEREIRGMVMGEDGCAVPGANVGCVALQEQGAALWYPGGNVYTDDEGRFRFGGLGDGEYTVTASRGDLGPAEAIVRSGAENAMLVLRPRISAVVWVLDAGGWAVSGIPVRVRGWPGDKTVETDADGRARFSGLCPDPRYALIILPSVGQPEMLIESWTPRDTTIRLPESLRVEGRAVNVSGEPAVDVEVWCLPPGGKWRGTTTGADGSFSIAGLPIGPVTLLALPDDASPVATDTRAVIVPAGKKDIRLVYRPGVEIRLEIREWPEDGRYCEARLVTASGETVGECEVDEDGMIEFSGVDEQAVYSLWIPPLDDGRTLYLTGVRPGPNRVAASLEDGGAIRGVLIRRVPATDVEVRLEGPGFTLDATFFPDGIFEVSGVPSGTFTVVAEGWLNGKPVRATARASRGESVKLILGED